MPSRKHNSTDNNVVARGRLSLLLCAMKGHEGSKHRQDMAWVMEI